MWLVLNCWPLDWLWIFCSTQYMTLCSPSWVWALMTWWHPQSTSPCYMSLRILSFLLMVGYQYWQSWVCLVLFLLVKPFGHWTFKQMGNSLSVCLCKHCWNRQWWQPTVLHTSWHHLWPPCQNWTRSAIVKLVLIWHCTLTFNNVAGLSDSIVPIFHLNFWKKYILLLFCHVLTPIFARTCSTGFATLVAIVLLINFVFFVCHCLLSLVPCILTCDSKIFESHSAFKKAYLLELVRWLHCVLILIVLTLISPYTSGSQPTIFQSPKLI